MYRPTRMARKKNEVKKLFYLAADFAALVPHALQEKKKTFR
jgi:hypothetical protein